MATKTAARTKNRRAWAVLEIKSVDEEKRILTGIATTPTPDRMNDVVEPLGVQLALPVPFLWQHRSGEPIGQVVAADVTEAGIEVTVQLAQDDEPGPLKNSLDYAWRAIQKGLVRGLSIGFRTLEEAWDRERGGYHVLRWELLELSAVTIPANGDATITAIKAADAGADADDRPAPARTKATLSTRKAPMPPTTLREKIQTWQNERAAKEAQHVALMEQLGDETIDEATAKEASDLQGEIESIDLTLKHLREAERIQAGRAQPVEAPNSEKAAESRGPGGLVLSPAIHVVKAQEKVQPGIQFSRFVLCMAATKGDPYRGLEIAKKRYPQAEVLIRTLEAMANGESMEELYKAKAAVSAGTTTDETWAAPLVDYQSLIGDFIDYLMPRTIIGQFGQNGIPDLNRIPFKVKIPGDLGEGEGYWVGEGMPKPLTKGAFFTALHEFAKVAAIAVLTKELIRFSNPSAETQTRRILTRALIKRMDTDFVDPGKAAEEGVSPASILNGVTPIPSSGTDITAITADIEALWGAADAAQLTESGAVYITTRAIARRLSMMRGPLENFTFPGLSPITGGSFLGFPLLVSDFVPPGVFILAFADEIFLSDDGMVTIDASDQASLQMDTAPTNDSPTPTHTTLVSMFQTNSVAFRAERYIYWSKRRAAAASYLTGVNWGGAEEPEP